ncbi:Inner membrane protein YdcZ [compost metagenome]
MPAPAAWWLLCLPLIAGAFLPLQAGINGQLAKQVSSVLAAALISFAVGTVALVALVLLQREVPTFNALKGLTWWHWSGGLLGAFFITTAAFAGPRIGAMLFMALVLAGQLTMAMALDHFGWAGFREAPASLGKLTGLVLIFGGIWLIRRS